MHFFDVDVGRSLLAKEGYAGTLEELMGVAGTFDARFCVALRGSALAETGSLPAPLQVLPESTQKRPKKEEHGLQLGETPEIPWMHVPDVTQDLVLREKSRVLLALSLVAASAPLPGVGELSVTMHNKVTRVHVTRPFPAGTRMLLPLVLGPLQIVTDSVHPHSVAVRAATQVLYLVP